MGTWLGFMAHVLGLKETAVTVRGWKLNEEEFPIDRAVTSSRMVASRARISVSFFFFSFQIRVQMFQGQATPTSYCTSSGVS